MMSPWTFSELTVKAFFFYVFLSFFASKFFFHLSLSRIPHSCLNSSFKLALFPPLFSSAVFLSQFGAHNTPTLVRMRTQCTPSLVVLIESPHVKRAAKSTRMFSLNLDFVETAARRREEGDQAAKRKRRGRVKREKETKRRKIEREREI